MDIGVLSFHRGDRPEFEKQMYKLIESQTRQPEVIHVVDYPPINTPDLTERFRKGYEAISQYCDVVFVMEVDDYYPPEYIEFGEKEWERKKGVQIMGWNESLYYHVGIRKYRIIPSEKHSSLMSSIIKSKLPIHWPPDDYIFLDIKLWQQLRGHLIPGYLAVGIKHGQGLCGGSGHKESFYKTNHTADQTGSFLKQITNGDEFYQQLIRA